MIVLSLTETLTVDQAVGGFRFLLWDKLLLVPGLGKPPLNGRSRDTPPDDFSSVGRPLCSLCDTRKKGFMSREGAQAVWKREDWQRGWFSRHLGLLKSLRASLLLQSSLGLLSGPPRDCQELFQEGERHSGLFQIQPQGSPPFWVNCEMTSGRTCWPTKEPTCHVQPWCHNIQPHVTR